MTTPIVPQVAPPAQSPGTDADITAEFTRMRSEIARMAWMAAHPRARLVDPAPAPVDEWDRLTAAICRIEVQRRQLRQRADALFEQEMALVLERSALLTARLAATTEAA